MSSIHKLSISGIRAFDNHDRETIEFGRPLTLIAGQNGVGKTTIIEALRYASTGDLPPNSKGGAFVHDPKMSSEREVLAQVKLAYFNTNGNQMVCTRSMQLTVKKATQTFKTLEGQLMITANGQRETISSRCADLDLQVPMSLGVSAAILNYVIFCHQEDSLWPLSEPSVVKKRFDDIFEASRFTKALDTLKVLGKDYNQDIKVQEKTVQYLRQDSDRAARLKTKLSELQHSVSIYTSDCDDLKSEMESRVRALNDLFEENQKFQQVVYELQQARKSTEDLKRQIANAEADLEVLDLEESEILSRLENFDQESAMLSESLDKIKADAGDLGNEMEQLQATQSKLALEKGMAQAALETYEKQKETLASSVKEWSSDLGVAFPEDPSAEEISQALESLSRDIGARHDALVRQHQDSQNGIQVTINTVLGQKLQGEHQLESHRESLKKIEKEVKAIKEKLKSTENELGEAGNVAYQQARISELQIELSKRQRELAEFENSGQLDEVVSKISSLQSTIDMANRELTRATARFDDESRLSILNENGLKKQYHLDTLLNSISAQFKISTGLDFDIDSADSNLKNATSQASGDLSDSEARLAETTDTLKDIKMRSAHIAKELEALRGTATELKSQAEAALPTDASIPEYPTILREVQDDVNVATENFEQVNFTTKYYSAAETQAASGHKCLLCQRDFNEQDLADFLEYMAKKKGAMPHSASTASEDLSNARQELEQLNGIAPTVARYNEIVNVEIPRLEEQAGALESEFAAAQQPCDEAKSRVESARSKLEQLQSLRGSAENIFRLRAEVANLRQEAANLESNNVSSSSKLGGPQQIQETITKTTKELRLAESTAMDLRDQQTTLKELLVKTQQDLAAKQLQLKSIELQTHAIETQNRKLEELTATSAEIEGLLPALTESTRDLSEKLKLAEDELRQAKIKGAKTEKETAAEQTRVRHAINAHNDLWQQLLSYESKYSMASLEDLDEASEKNRSKLEEMKQSMADLKAKEQDVDHKLIDSRGQKRVLQDNLQVQKMKLELNTVLERVAKLESKGAEREKERYERETNEMQAAISELNSVHGSKLGEIKQMQEQILQLEGELSTDYKDVNVNFKKASVKLDSTITATSDLTTYSKALDGAIMQYHALKMSEVNKVLDELWKKTYTGTDIDTILIKSENENKTTRAAYNYRVCMVKQDTELDMRGRCSAGQKVLASVIIRLALSECFGVNSGLIVLDEPTTNLDHSNIESLARSLSQIIDVRRAQKNFQLIIITHDEHFLTSMSAGDYTDHFYRIERDSRQMSRIERVPVGQLVE